MKKVLILTMLGFVFSFGAYASGEVKIKKGNGLVEKRKKENQKVETIVLTEFCGELDFYIVDCPDGSIGTYIGFVVYDCETLGGVFYWGDFLDEEDGYGC
jgi:hypothetical protein